MLLLLLGGFSGLLGRDLGELLVMLLDLPGVDLLLELLGLGFLLEGAILRDFLHVELMLSLELVGIAALAEKTAKEDDGEGPAANGVPGEDV